MDKIIAVMCLWYILGIIANLPSMFQGKFPYHWRFIAMWLKDDPSNGYNKKPLMAVWILIHCFIIRPFGIIPILPFLLLIVAYVRIKKGNTK